MKVSPQIIDKISLEVKEINEMFKCLSNKIDALNVYYADIITKNTIEEKTVYDQTKKEENKSKKRRTTLPKQADNKGSIKASNVKKSSNTDDKGKSSTPHRKR